MRFVGPIILLVTAALLAATALATGEHGYCRMIHLVAKPLGLGALALWAFLWCRRRSPSEWTLAAKSAWIAIFVAMFGLHAYGALAQAPAFCNQPVCAEAAGPSGWYDCLMTRWRTPGALP
jgi:uncharacterized membrane protein